MIRLRPQAILLGLALVPACRLEHRVPAGAASESDRIREVVTAFYRTQAEGNQAEFQRLFTANGTVALPGSMPGTVAAYWSVIQPRLGRGIVPAQPRAGRTQVRVQGRLASAWVTTEWQATGEQGPGRTERALFHLLRDGSTWRVAAVGFDDGV